MPGELKGREVVFRADVGNEQVAIAAALASGERADGYRREALRTPPGAFLVPEHATIWKAIREAHNRGLAPDPATLARLSSNAVNVAYLAELMAARPDLPDDATLKFALEQLAWDRQKHIAVTGPIESLLEAIGKGEQPERCRGLARAVAASFDGWGDRRHMHDPEELVREQIADVRKRMAGLASYPYGLDGLDYYEPAPGEARGKKRIVVGAAPSLVTMITGYTSSGKSSLAALLSLLLARKGRKVLYGAWEMGGGMTLEAMACMSLAGRDKSFDWSRARLHEPDSLGEEHVARLQKTMLAIEGIGAPPGSGWVHFMKNPFGRIPGKESNERNLDVVNGYIADSGCDVFVADLWERCLVDDSPSEEKRALFRQQAMVAELDVHAILLSQQRKDMAGRRPTAEGIKGSGAYAEISDTLFGVYRPYLCKAVPDDRLEIDVLKQRQGVAPLSIEFDWDPQRGTISGGRSIEYERPMAAGGGNPLDLMMREPKAKKDARR